jgi:hypothetical protein
MKRRGRPGGAAPTYARVREVSARKDRFGTSEKRLVATKSRSCLLCLALRSATQALGCHFELPNRGNASRPASQKDRSSYSLRHYISSPSPYQRGLHFYVARGQRKD